MPESGSGAKSLFESSRFSPLPIAPMIAESWRRAPYCVSQSRSLLCVVAHIRGVMYLDTPFRGEAADPFPHDGTATPSRPAGRIGSGTGANHGVYAQAPADAVIQAADAGSGGAALAGPLRAADCAAEGHGGCEHRRGVALRDREFGGSGHGDGT